MNLITAYSSQDESGSENSVEPPPKKLDSETKKPQVPKQTSPVEPKVTKQAPKNVEIQPI